MRLFTYYPNPSNKQETKVGIFKDASQKEFIAPLEVDPGLPVSLLEIIASPAAMKRVKEIHDQANLSWKLADEIAFAPVIPKPEKIVCMGLNYADHAKEGGHDRPEYPSFFMRVPSSLLGHQQAMIVPPVSDKLDYEAELAFIIGKRCHRLTKENALEAIAGYSIFNDGSMRDYQRKTNQWTIGKNFDQTGGFGPCLVTPEELPKGAHGLRIQSRLNGKIMQDSNTEHFLWDVVETLVLISEVMTLEPGDVVITGTPAGVGYARTPPVFMKPGDMIEIEIDGIGILKNPIASESAK
jgi:2-keto-4-pentenoate hydratase/2-oxohepta-3-ene-1,7-dioic acid hydratase in catechol pathway